jgi:hypothetical protein
MATGVAIYGSAVFTPKEVELLSISFDASYTHMYVPGTRARKAGPPLASWSRWPSTKSPTVAAAASSVTSPRHGRRSPP